MTATLFLAEAANLNSDGTVTMFRAGLSSFIGPEGRPIPLKAALVLRLTADSPEDVRPYRFGLQFSSEGGGVEYPMLLGEAEPPKLGGSAYLIWNLAGEMPGPGRYIFSLSVDGQTVATCLAEASHVFQPSVEQSGTAETQEV